MSPPTDLILAASVGQRRDVRKSVMRIYGGWIQHSSVLGVLDRSCGSCEQNNYKICCSRKAQFLLLDDVKVLSWWSTRIQKGLPIHQII